ncbi:MAG: hypothetical protein JSS76_08465 [Bacteroidetes bacterium]|nr:hypothetical protein [Bacteroidota bacterium]
MSELANDLDKIAAYIASPLETMDLPPHLERKANACTLIASLLLEYPFKPLAEIERMVIRTYPELKKGTIASYVRDTKYIYGQLDKIDRGFERSIIKAQIGKALNTCYMLGDMRPVPKLLELWMKLYRLDRPDALGISTEEMKGQIQNIWMIQKNEYHLDNGQVVPLDEMISKLERQLRDEKVNEGVIEIKADEGK